MVSQVQGVPLSKLWLPRTDGLIGAGASVTSKRLPKLERCVTVKCPQSVLIDMGPEAYGDERRLRNALASSPGWTVQPCQVRRTMASPIKGWAVLCPQCTDELKRKEGVASVLATPFDAGR
jgi:hypothetical protein